MTWKNQIRTTVVLKCSSRPPNSLSLGHRTDPQKRYKNHLTESRERSKTTLPFPTFFFSFPHYSCHWLIAFYLYMCHLQDSLRTPTALFCNGVWSQSTHFLPLVWVGFPHPWSFQCQHAFEYYYYPKLPLFLFFPMCFSNCFKCLLPPLL